MSTIADVLRRLEPEQLPDRWEAEGLDRASDAELVEAVGQIVGIPLIGPPSSFVLHAPLELLARAALLPHVEPSSRRAARWRIASIASTYARADEPAPRPAPFPDAPAPQLARSLVEAIDAGDMDRADAVATALTRRTDADELVGLVADAVVPRTSAAAHGSIFLYLLPRFGSSSPAAATAFRTLARELARHPDWRLTWQNRIDVTTASVPLEQALLDVPRLGAPGSTFIHPVLDQIQSSGVAAEVLEPAIGSDIDQAEARRTLLRVAAWSMLQDDPEHAPYGWTHCLTIAQATAGVAHHTSDPLRTLAIAASQVAGFRAAEGAVDLVPPDGPPPVTTSLTDLATAAAVHHDAHLAKYVVACADASRTDPEQATLYLAAAAYLVEWWRRQD